MGGGGGGEGGGNNSSQHKEELTKGELKTRFMQYVYSCK